jgi:phosphoribosyl 1,2-cyclic phosphodiesterase
MSLYISSINSGSNGNCYYVGNQQEAILVDAGLSCRETETRIARAGLDFKKIKAIFITHEHSDHIRGAEFIARKHQIPVYISKGTFATSSLKLEQKLLKNFNAYESLTVGNLVVVPFPKQHDASDPYSFTVTDSAGITVGIMTDIGTACEHVVRNFQHCHAAFLEANYDEGMLKRGKYPEHLKKRIRSDYGHLSNHQALELFKSHKSDSMSHLLLSHLSQENNNPGLVRELFAKHVGNVVVTVAPRHKESAVYCITGEKLSGSDKKGNDSTLKVVQPTLF